MQSRSIATKTIRKHFNLIGAGPLQHLSDVLSIDIFGGFITIMMDTLADVTIAVIDKYLAATCPSANMGKQVN